MHVGIIMDGNGRWAARYGLPRAAGHRAGARVVSRIVASAARSDVDVLTLYAFSSDNWSRPAHEVTNLMGLLEHYLINETGHCSRNGVRVRIIGRRDRLSARVMRAVEHAERCTESGDRLTLQLAVDYSARTAIIDAARLAAARERQIGPEHASEFSDCLADAGHAERRASSVDLLIRTGGERRLSDFLLWECAYAELVFVDTCWPEFDETQFQAALADFRSRQRRFGGLPQTDPEGPISIPPKEMVRRTSLPGAPPTAQGRILEFPEH